MSEESPPQKKKLGSTALRFASALPLIPLVLWLLFWAPKIGFQIFGAIWIAIWLNALASRPSSSRVRTSTRVSSLEPTAPFIPNSSVILASRPLMTASS